MSNLELFDRIAGNVMCDILTDAGPALLGTSIYTAATGVGTPVALGTLGAAAASYLAKNYLCDPIDVGDASPIPNVDGCQRVDGYGTAQLNDGTGRWFNPFAGTELANKSSQAVAVSSNRIELRETGGYDRITTWETTDGDITWSSFANVQPPQPAIARVLVTNGTCQIEGGTPQPLPPEVYQPREYTDSVDGCTYNVTFQGFLEETPGGQAQPVLLIEGTAETRSGGRIGGCNFEPQIYMPDGGGGGTSVPGPPGPPGPPGTPNPNDKPWWFDPLVGALAGAVLNQILDAIKEALAPVYNPATFTLTAPCDKDEEGNQLSTTWEFEQGTFQQRSLTHQVALMEILQQHLNWKTPTCREARPEKRGTWISTHWISDAASPNSNRQIRKLFRYRSESTRTNDELQQYWADFEWTTGPVIVTHKGAWWGTPKVWAASAEEGQRVIRFAGGEAGLDPDQDGEWVFSSSDSPRYGVSLKVRLAEEQGERWVTRREGASGFPAL